MTDFKFEYRIVDVAFISQATSFVAVDPKCRNVKVSTPNGVTQTYQVGQQIPLMFGGELAVDAIFE